jgi:hypothetical protein
VSSNFLPKASELHYKALAQELLAMQNNIATPSSKFFLKYGPGL